MLVGAALPDEDVGVADDEVEEGGVTTAASNHIRLIPKYAIREETYMQSQHKRCNCLNEIGKSQQ